MIQITTKRATVFERYPKTTLAGVWFFAFVIFFICVEFALSSFTGLGHPVLFLEDPSFGYRLKPNQETYRFGGAHFKINNLGLRANEDWDSSVDDKILFLGDSVTYGGNRISNEELFSEIATRGIEGFETGNVGMPNYGVENVYGLVVNSGFLPAKFYVTVFIEEDFYRGLVQAGNRPWIMTESPHFALEELARWVWFRYFANTRASNQRQTARVSAADRRANAARKLKEMDTFLKSKGYSHLIFISPSQPQVLGEAPIDSDVKAVLDQYEVDAIYLLPKIAALPASEDDRKAWFQDNYHLTARGHEVWGELMRQELSKWIAR